MININIYKKKNNKSNNTFLFLLFTALIIVDRESNKEVFLVTLIFNPLL